MKYKNLCNVQLLWLLTYIKLEFCFIILVYRSSAFNVVIDLGIFFKKLVLMYKKN